MSITKQSVNDLVGHLESTGYLVREPDPLDGRARVLRLTAKGRRLQRSVDVAARDFETNVGESLGAKRTAELRRALELLIDGLGAPDGD
jgi:DNA-binding MarR family transcriptional regulator